VAQHHGLGGAGAVDLANAVIRTCQKPANFEFTYPLDLSLKVGRRSGAGGGGGFRADHLARLGWAGLCPALGAVLRMRTSTSVAN